MPEESNTPMTDALLAQQLTSALLAQQLNYISEQLNKLTVQVAEMLAGGKERDAHIIQLRLLLRDYKEVEDKVEFMLPWVAGMRWFSIIAGGIVAMAIVVGVLWAVAQSGAWLP